MSGNMLPEHLVGDLCLHPDDCVEDGVCGRCGCWKEDDGRWYGDIPEATVGVHRIPEAAYHADPVPNGSLSSTGVRKLIAPSCPAHFKQWRDAGEEPKTAWDIGSAAHKLVLGAGPELVAIAGDGKSGPETWNTGEVKTKVTEARERGAVPLKPSAYDTVRAMAERLREHPEAAALFDPAAGSAEQTIIWQDERTGVMCRALIDFLRWPASGSRLLLPDYKTTGAKYGASPDKVGRTMGDFGYHVQLAWYLMGLRALGLAGEDAQALLVIQETAAPYLVTVAQPEPTAMRMGAIRCRQALDLYADCVKNDRWPGYSDEVVYAELPPWETRELNGVIW